MGVVILRRRAGANWFRADAMPRDPQEPCGEHVIEQAEIQLDGGLGFRGTVDPYTLHLRQACDGRRPLAEAVRELLTKGHGTDPARLAAVVAEAARRLAALEITFQDPAGGN